MDPVDPVPDEKRCLECLELGPIQPGGTSRGSKVIPEIHDTDHHQDQSVRENGNEQFDRNIKGKVEDLKIEENIPAIRGHSNNATPNLKKFTSAVRNYSQVFLKNKEKFLQLVFVLVLLSWWLTGISLKRTRGKWIITTILTWTLLLMILRRWISFENFSKSISGTFKNLAVKFQKDNSSSFLSFIVTHSKCISFGFGWLILLSSWLFNVFGTRLNSSRNQSESYFGRVRALVGLIILQFLLWFTSNNKKLIRWRTILVGLILQEILSVLVLKTEAGFHFFNWIAKAATDLLNQGTRAAEFFFSKQVIQNHWFFVNALAAMIFFIAFIQLLYYLGVMNAILTKFGWVFHTLMGVSGGEAVVAAASPFVGQGSNAILVKPFIAHMTPSEFHQVMTSGFATIAGSVVSAYVDLGMPAVYLISASIMSIPASLQISKLRFPENSTSLTAGGMVISKEEDTEKEGNAIQAFSNGACLGLKIAGMILANVLTVLGLLYTVDGILTWIGQFWGMDPNGSHPLTLELILQYVFYPIAWLMGTPHVDILKISKLLALKMISNEFLAYQRLAEMKPEMTDKGFLIGVYCLCGFANLSSLGVQIGILSSLAPTRKDDITHLAVSALMCGFLSTVQSA
ncbi:hypothetical protein O181_074268, partial [Austropuccinia psidii MF-1]|nr:hypothetical protein [Austropuccinia psidii MF-1]